MENYLNIIGLVIVAFAILSVIAVITAMAFARSEKRADIDYYSLDKEWTFGPLLFSAVDMPSLGSGEHMSYDDPRLFIGGSAHGKW